MFFVAAGTLNVNTNTHTERFIDRITQDTETAMTSTHYELVGIGGSGPPCGPGSTVAAAQPAALGAPSAATGALPLFAALLPGSRSVKVGCPATVFVTVINAKARNHSNTPRWGSSTWHDLWLAE